MQSAAGGCPNAGSTPSSSTSNVPGLSASNWPPCSSAAFHAAAGRGLRDRQGQGRGRIRRRATDCLSTRCAGPPRRPSAGIVDRWASRGPTRRPTGDPVELAGLHPTVRRGTIGWVNKRRLRRRIRHQNSHLVRIPVSTLETRWRNGVSSASTAPIWSPGHGHRLREHRRRHRGADPAERLLTGGRLPPVSPPGRPGTTGPPGTRSDPQIPAGLR